MTSCLWRRCSSSAISPKKSPSFSVAFRPDGKPAATLIPPAFGLAGVGDLHVTVWVSSETMQGVGDNPPGTLHVDLYADSFGAVLAGTHLGRVSVPGTAIGESPAVLADALESMSHLDKELSRLYVYASMLSDQDTREADAQGMQQEMQQVFARFMAQASFIEPELLKLPAAV